MGRSVRINKTVHAEIAVIVSFPKISAVAVFYPSLSRLTKRYRMVAPLPHKATAETLIGIEYIVIILQISRAISHGVAVFTLHKRSVFLRLFKIAFQPV